MRRFISLFCIGACLLAAACAEPALDKKVLVIGLDGVRPDVLAEVSTPIIDALIAGGAFNGRVETQAQTVSGPGWSSVLTGVWPEKHKVTSNDFSGNDYTSYPDFLTRLEQIDAAFTTFAVVDWLPLGSEASGGPLISDEIDAKLTFDGDEIGYAATDSQSVAAAIRFLSNQDPDAAFVYIGYPDVAGHEHGGRSPEYNASIALADAHVGQLLEAVHARPTFAQEDWLILVVTDHGHKDEGGHGGLTPEEKTVFYLASGPSTVRATRRDANLVDVAVTALAHLGVEIDPSWDLDGNVTGLRGRH